MSDSWYKVILDSFGQNISISAIAEKMTKGRKANGSPSPSLIAPPPSLVQGRRGRFSLAFAAWMVIQTASATLYVISSRRKKS